MARIIVADEDREVRELIIFSLKFAGHKVYGASIGDEVLSLVKQIKPDLLLADIHLKIKNSNGISNSLVDKIDTLKIPVIFLSTSGQDVNLITEIVANGFDMIDKPVSPDQLIQKVNKCLKKNGGTIN
jgi:DNA-binding response OmpR family regulator